MSDFDIERARRETPGCDDVVHFNNAGASLQSLPVLNAVFDHLHLEAKIGGYEAEAMAHAELERTYDALATMLNCRREEIALVENATRAWDMLFYSLPLQPGDRILTAQCEYASNYIAMLQRAKQTGAEIVPVPNESTGRLSLSALQNLLDERVKLIAMTHVPTNGGLVNPAVEVGEIAQQAGVLYLLDACQSAGQMELDVERIGCDMLTATGRKYLRGPRGTGFLYVRNEILDQLEPPFLDMFAAEWVSKDRFEMRNDARRFETFESNIAARIGLGVAVDYALEWGLDAIEERIAYLAGTLRGELEQINGVTIQDLGPNPCGIVSFTVAGVASAVVQQRLAMHSINVRVSPLRATRLDMEARNLADVVRASVHYYNTEEEITRLCRAVAQLINVY